MKPVGAGRGEKEGETGRDKDLVPREEGLEASIVCPNRGTERGNGDPKRKWCFPFPLPSE